MSHFDTEDQLQAFIFQHFWNSCPQYRRQMFAVPNGGQRHNGNKYKATGMLAGIPDLVFFSEQALIFFELKKPEGKLSSKQVVQKLKIVTLNRPFFVVRTPDQFFYALIFILMERNELNTEQSIELMKAVQDNEGLVFFGLTSEQFEYEIKVFRYLYSMPADDQKNIADMTSEETREQFIATVKKFIHLEYDKSNSFQITFNQEFSTFVKQIIF